METAEHLALRTPALACHALAGLPMVEAGDDLAALLIAALESGAEIRRRLRAPAMTFERRAAS